MTKTFLHGRTEAIRSVTETSKEFVDVFYSPTATSHEKLEALRKALKRHTALTRECAKGLGHDRHLYAMECLWERTHHGEKKPLIFTDGGWKTMNHTVISTSNCGNPALRLFGFGPVVSDGFGIGYIIKEDGIAVSFIYLDTPSFTSTHLNCFLSLLHPPSIVRLNASFLHWKMSCLKSNPCCSKKSTLVVYPNDNDCLPWKKLMKSPMAIATLIMVTSFLILHPKAVPLARSANVWSLLLDFIHHPLFKHLYCIMYKTKIPILHVFQ